MKTNEAVTPLKVILQQTDSNNIAWMGQGLTNEDIVAGQTFTCPAEGELGGIEIFSSLVIKPGQAHMTLHPFDPQLKKWGEALVTTSIKIDKADNQKWVLFPQKGLQLKKGSTYGFRIKSDDMLVGIGEASGNYKQPPLQGGQEWTSTAGNTKGRYYNYFSLAFKVEVKE